jgi:hypothetical protein
MASRRPNSEMILTTRRLFVSILLLALVALAARNITDPDFGWHYRTGELVLSTLSIPSTDSFSFTAVGASRINHDWLSDVFIFSLYQIGGIGALVTFFALAAAAALALVYARCGGKPFLAAFVILLAALTVAPFWGTRPQTLSLLFASISLYILDRHMHMRAGRQLLWLVPLTLVWANAHGSFILGPVFISVYFVASVAENVLKWNDQEPPRWENAAQLFSVFLLCLAVIALNPYHLELYLYPFQTLVSPTIQTFIQEWQSPDFSSTAVQPFIWFLVATMGTLALARRRTTLAEALLLAGLTYASLRAARQISIWALIAAPVLATSVSDILEPLYRKLNRSPVLHPTRTLQILNWAVLVVVAVAVVARIGIVIMDESRAERAYFPVDAVNYIQTQNLSGPIFNNYNWGGYLIWRMYPRERVFIDGRSDLYGLTDDSIVREYLEAYTGGENWRAPLDQFGVQLVLVEPDAPIVIKLAQDAAWRQVYEDKQAVIFRKE